MHWQSFSPNDFNRVMEIILYNTVAAILGLLTDRHETEHERLLKAESLAAMGRAVSGVAHDMKTPLIAIGGFTKMVQRNMEKGDPCYQKLDIVVHETLRLEKMVKDMLDFSRPLELCPIEEDLHELIRRSIAVVEESAQERKVKIRFRLADGLSPILCDSARMEQVFINLLMNAVQASPEGETVKVKAVREGNRIRVDISDDGCGIPHEQREEIFAPFFTTKKEGTGLGLPIVKKIVEAHDGRLDLSDNPEKGVTFSVLLPLRNVGRFTNRHLSGNASSED